MLEVKGLPPSIDYGYDAGKMVLYVHVENI